MCPFIGSVFYLYLPSCQKSASMLKEAVRKKELNKTWPTVCCFPIHLLFTKTRRQNTKNFVFAKCKIKRKRYLHFPGIPGSICCSVWMNVHVSILSDSEREQIDLIYERNRMRRRERDTQEERERGRKISEQVSLYYKHLTFEVTRMDCRYLGIQILYRPFYLNFN